MKKTLAWQALLATAFSVFAVAVQAADRYWVATTPTNWNRVANWSTTSGGGGGASVPGSPDIASLVGSEDQTILHYYPGTNTIPSAAFTINKTGGTATLLSDVRLGSSNQDLIWTAGGLDLGANTLTVNRNVTISSGATTLGLTIADATTAGNIVAGGNASQLQHADLLVTVAGARQIVDGQSYTILSNSATVQAFADVTWAPSLWSATVVYDTAVVLSDVVYSPRGTVIRVR